MRFILLMIAGAAFVVALATVMPRFMRAVDKNLATKTLHKFVTAEKEYFQANHEFTKRLAKLNLPDDLRSLVGENDLSLKMGTTFYSVDCDDNSFVAYADDHRFRIDMDARDSVILDTNYTL